MVQKYIEDEFSEKLKKFTITEGQILIKLIHRQTGETAFDLIKTYEVVGAPFGIIIPLDYLICL